MRIFLVLLLQAILEIFVRLWATIKALCFLILLPIIMVAAEISSYIGNAYLRKRNGQIQVPTITYEHIKTKQRVKLIGVLHLGDKEFFEHTKRLLDTLEDEMRYVILYEFMRDETLPSDSNRYFKSDNGLITKMAYEKMMIVDQFDIISPRDTWINTDLSSQEYYGLLSFMESMASGGCLLDAPTKKMATKEEYDKEKNEINKELKKRILQKCFAINLRMWMTIPSSILLDWRSKTQAEKNFNEITITMRNEIAVSGILNALQYADNVASIWGSGHLPGIGKELEERGFKQIEKYWVTAYTLKNYPLSYLFGRE